MKNEKDCMKDPLWTENVEWVRLMEPERETAVYCAEGN